MAYPNYRGYQYETSPRKVKPEYEKTKVKQKKEIIRNEEKIKAKKQVKPKAKVILYLAIGFTVLFAISYRNSLITESFNQKEDLKKQLSSIEKENEQLKINIENSLNLNNVEQSAKEMLGMQKLDNSQKVYISLPKKDYVEPAMKDVVTTKKMNMWQKMLKGLTQNIK